MDDLFTDIPDAVKLRIAEYIEKPSDFNSLSLTNKAWSLICHAVGFQLKSFSLLPYKQPNCDPVVHILLNGRSHDKPTVRFLKTKTGVRTIYRSPDEEEAECEKAREQPVSLRRTSVEVALAMLTHYRVRDLTLHMMYSLPEDDFDVTALLRQMTRNLRLRCQSLNVINATIQQINILTQRVEADHYAFEAVGCKPVTDFEINRNLMNCRGSINLRGITMKSFVDVPVADLSVRSIVIKGMTVKDLVGWQQDWVEFKNTKRKYVYLEKVKLDIMEVVEMLKHNPDASKSSDRNSWADSTAIYNFPCKRFVGEKMEAALLTIRQRSCDVLDDLCTVVFDTRIKKETHKKVIEVEQPLPTDGKQQNNGKVKTEAPAKTK